MEAPFPFLGMPPAIVQTLLELGAVSATSAVTLGAGSGIHEPQLEHLLQAGIVRQAPSGAYYLVEDAWARRCGQQRRRIAVGSTAIVSVIILVLVLVRIWKLR